MLLVQVIGGVRNNVFSILVKRNIRPVILFFENVSSFDCRRDFVFSFLCVSSQFHQLELQVMKGNQIVFGSLGQ